MDYNLIITKRAEDTLERSISFIIDKLNNKNAAKTLLNELGSAYTQISESPTMFPFCYDSSLAESGIRKCILKKSRYLVLFRIVDKNVYIRAIVNMKEDYSNII